ncbi:carbon catabolite repressor protein 4-like [Heracleum sosnowskyi]|uniref:Carbon catabolite repressor protein 4-like n=1 Tax=Heracleum sosnowskyi TaxID=360622 RepID=A0AAD8NAN0_9APIA|nr:carbon catabolite repressor protein 4-like [Heracleum sosnowskyi]
MSTSTGPITRKFIPVEHSQLDSGSGTHGFEFRLVSYNILAQAYVSSVKLTHSTDPCLKWEDRCQAVLTVLRSFVADILCLQEVDEYDTFYKGNIESHGYSSVYIQRSGTKPDDGCGIFYRNNILKLVMEEKIDYNDLVNSSQKEAGSYVDINKTAVDNTNQDAAANEGFKPEKTEDYEDLNDPRVRLKRDCVGIMAAFRPVDCSEHLVIVANTHLYWDPELADVKLAQAKYLLSRLTKFRNLVADKFDCKPSVLLSGDFNSVPGDKVYQYLISGSSSIEPRLEEMEDRPIPINSVYASLRGEPQFTNCTPGFTGTLDYIFFSPSGCIKPISYLDLPEADSSDVKGAWLEFHLFTFEHFILFLRKSLKRLLPRLEKLLWSESFKVKAVLLTVFGSVTGTNGSLSQQIVRNFVKCFVEFVGSEDWAARKAAAEALVKLWAELLFLNKD